MKEFFKLLYLKFKVTAWNIREYFRVVVRYYPNAQFRKADVFLLRHYILQNPFRIAKEHLKKKGEGDIYTYGETPLTTLEKISVACGIKAEDRVYELGSGRGRSCVWLYCFKGCSVTGIEYIPEFVRIAQKTKRRYEIEGVKFIYKDFLDVDFTDATLIYYYGTCAEPSFIAKLIEKLKNLAPGTKIITVSYPLSDYAETSQFELVKTFTAPFTWGEAEVFLQIKL